MNKKTIIGIVIVILLLAVILGGTFYYLEYNKEQLNNLKIESEKILQLDLFKDEIDDTVAAKGQYGIVEETMKSYLSKQKELYNQAVALKGKINPNEIISAQNFQDNIFSNVDENIKKYEEQNNNIFNTYKENVKEEYIRSQIDNKITGYKSEYYKELYTSVMISETMKKQLDYLQTKLEKQKEKNQQILEGILTLKNFLKENKDYWEIKEERFYFKNVKKMTEYYNILNKINIEE